MSGNEGSFDDEECIVIDNGSYRLLAGFSGDKTPRWSIYSISGKNKDATDEVPRGVHYGDDAYAKRSILDVKCPIQRGIITDWDEMEKVLQERSR